MPALSFNHVQKDGEVRDEKAFNYRSAALASSSYYDAQVIKSTPIYHVVETSTPKQQCWEEQVQRHSRGYDGYRSNTPGILGAVVGGAIGNAVGHNTVNERVGAVVGAILGGSIGRDIAHNSNPPPVYTDTVERCRTVYDTSQEEKLVGYDVLYSYNGQEYTVRMPQDPGATVRVRVSVEPVL